MKKNNDKESNHKFLLFLSNFSTEHWIITISLTSGLPWIFSILLGYFGEFLHLVTVDEYSSRKLSPLGLTITFIITAILVLNTIVKKFKKNFPDETIKELQRIKTQLEIKTAGYNLFDKILFCITGVCKNKLSKQMRTIVEIKNNNLEPPKIYSEPCNQIEIILDKLLECLSFLLSANNYKFNKSDLYASIVYNFPQENKNVWKWADVSNEQGLSIEDLLSDGTTFSYLLNKATEQSPSVFFNSKQEAFINKHYIPDDCDKYDKGKLLGSIACFRITLKRSDITYVTAVLGICSYDKKFVKVSSENSYETNSNEIERVKRNIEDIVVKEFSERIKIELCNHYIQFLRNKWEKLI